MNKKILIIAAAFATFDGIQAVCTGALKGLKETKAILVIMSLSYLLISIPFGLISAYKFNIILEGFWGGLFFGIFTACVVSGTIVIKKYFKIKQKSS